MPRAQHKQRIRPFPAWLGITTRVLSSTRVLIPSFPSLSCRSPTIPPSRSISIVVLKLYTSISINNYCRAVKQGSALRCPKRQMTLHANAMRQCSQHSPVSGARTAKTKILGLRVVPRNELPGYDRRKSSRITGYPCVSRASGCASNCALPL